MRRVLAKLTVAIILQYIHISNHYIEHLKTMLYINYISIKLERKRNKLLRHTITWTNPENVTLCGKAGHKSPHGVSSVYKKCLE